MRKWRRQPLHSLSQEDECQYAHTGSVDKKLEMCKFYLNAHCAKGKACIFMHEEYPCKFYHLGMTCYSGSDCKFSHGPLDTVTGPMIEKVGSYFPSPVSFEVELQLNPATTDPPVMEIHL